MSSVPRLTGAPGVRLALPLWPGDGTRPAWRRRAALGLALLVLAVLGVLVAGGTGARPGAAPATDAPRRQPSPATAATLAEPGGEPRSMRAALPASGGLPASDRVVEPAHPTALFAPHSWYVRPPPKPAAPPPPPPPAPEPTAPPFPYKFLGSLSPEGGPPVFFLAHGDRVIDAHVGDRISGVYHFESAAGGQLVFTYLPLNVRQTLAASVSK